MNDTSLVRTDPFMNACAHAGATMEYYIGYLNKTGHDMEVSVYVGNKLWALPTMLVAGGEATQGSISKPIPVEAEVRIIDGDEQKSIKVSLKDVPKKGFRDGTIYFVINTNGTVDVKPIRLGEEAAMAGLVKGLRPAGEYRLGFVNKTGHDLEAATVFYGDKRAGTGGDIPARVKLGYSDPLTLPFPSVVEVRWTEAGTSHAVKVNVEGVPKGFEGRVFFVIKADHTVEVHPVKKGDDKSAIDLVK
jgi:hypothetical protein